MKPNTHTTTNQVYFKKCQSLPFVEMRKASKSSACYHSHSHDEFSFGVIDTGSAKYNNLRKTHRITTGNTVTINPGDIHDCNPDAGDWSYRMLFVNSTWLGRLQSESFNLNNIDYQAFERPYETQPIFYAAFHQLFENLLTEENALISESSLVEFIALCFTHKNNLISKNIIPTKQKLVRAKELLLDELGKNHTLDDLSKVCGLSRYHFIRSFKHIYGLSPHALQLDERIKKSKEKLKLGCSILDVATELGFTDQSHFQRNFKKRLAITPKQYQNYFI